MIAYHRRRGLAIPTILSCIACASLAESSAQHGVGNSRQLIVVSTPDWNSVDGRLHRYERASVDGSWRPVGATATVVVGKKGLAWGAGLQGAASALADHSDPVKTEGDEKAPAGVFLLGTAFGDAAHSHVPGTSLPYRLTTPTLECVDDPSSAFYNQLIDTTDIHRTWHSSEIMRRPDSKYNLGVFVDYNVKPATPGRGSCIFLHIWSGAGKGTVGCTAMPEAALREIVAWLNSLKQPLLVQMPADRLRRFADRSGIPIL